MKITVLIATRGIVHSRMIESVLKNLNQVQDLEWKFFFTHDLPIPDAQNTLVRNALEWNPDYYWFVEEDMLIPDTALFNMIGLAGDVVAVDYPVGESQCGCVCKKAGEILWCGLGCTLIDSRVIKAMSDPWFRTDKTVRITNLEKMEFVIDEKVPYKYGGHDILFGIEVREKGFKITQVPEMTAGHMKVIQEGRSGFNKGTHQIEIVDKIRNFQIYD